MTAVLGALACALCLAPPALADPWAGPAAPNDRPPEWGSAQPGDAQYPGPPSDPQWPGQPAGSDQPGQPGDPWPTTPATPQVPTPTPGVPSLPSKPARPSWPPQPVAPQLPIVTTHTVKGKVAMLRTDGKAAVPRSAPKAVRDIIAAANEIIGKPYKWGGGHAVLFDKGYDCSGTVSFALIRTGLLAAPLVSGSLAHWGAAGAGRYVTIYANAGHVYMEVAGLRLDTSPVGDPTGRNGVRWRPLIGKRQGFHVRHPVGL